MANANPLSMYVPIKQDDRTQSLVKDVAAGFVDSVKAGLDGSNIVHYARLVLIPKPKEKKEDPEKVLGILLVTVFDGPMNPYLEYFWKQPGINIAIQGVASLALHPPALPFKTVDAFQNFINSVNISAPRDLYSAYDATVKQIKAAFPPE
jgi:hypothetical protein